MIDAVRVPELLLPAPGVDLTKWAVVACDQFTSEIAYWQEVERIVGDAPSTLRLTYPEAYLLEENGVRQARVDAIHGAMGRYLQENVFAAPCRGFILTERTTKSGTRVGLMLAIDLAAYDFAKGARPLIRPTEGTIIDRIPPRVRVRKGAPIETPHVMLLMDDPARAVIEPLYAGRKALPLLYDVELMQGGGHLRGYAIEDSAKVLAALETLPSLKGDDPILFAVGDGNHSLATARQCYLDSPSVATRYALVEVVNLYDEAIQFEPIHRLILGVDPDAIRAEARARGISLHGGDVRAVQPFLDAVLPATAKVDYIHGEAALKNLSVAPDTLGISMAPLSKDTLFETLRGGGVLPRKAFSMGEAWEKRYYMECRILGG